MITIILTAAPARLEITVSRFVDRPIMAQAIAVRPLNAPTIRFAPQDGVEGSFTVEPEEGKDLIEFLRAHYKRSGGRVGSDVPAGDMSAYQEQGGFLYKPVWLSSGMGIEEELETHHVSFKSTSKTKI